MIRITCIGKDNGDHYDPHEGILNFGWVDDKTGNTGISTRAAMIDFLEKGNSAYVKGSFNRIAWLVVSVSRYGNKYIKTIADDRETNNLLALAECPLYL